MEKRSQSYDHKSSFDVIFQVDQQPLLDFSFLFLVLPGLQIFFLKSNEQITKELKNCHMHSNLTLFSSICHNLTGTDKSITLQQVYRYR